MLLFQFTIVDLRFTIAKPFLPFQLTIVDLRITIGRYSLPKSFFASFAPLDFTLCCPFLFPFAPLFKSSVYSIFLAFSQVLAHGTHFHFASLALPPFLPFLPFCLSAFLPYSNRYIFLFLSNSLKNGSVRSSIN